VSGRPAALRRELTRKTIHLLAAAAPLAYAGGAPRSLLLSILGGGAVIAIAVEGGRRASERVQRTLDKAVGHLFRPHEHASITGATWLILGMLAATAILPKPLAIATMWAAAVGDPAAGLVGRTVGRIRVHKQGKSLEGSLACLATTALGAMLLAGLRPSWALFAGITAALAEWPRAPFDDNLRIIVGVGTTLSVLRMFVA
jgi:dolichol kinase